MVAKSYHNSLKEITMGIEEARKASRSMVGFYRHHKGDVYYVSAIALHTETEALEVVYRKAHKKTNNRGIRQDNDVFFVRPLEMFLEDVEVEGDQTPRFKKLKNSSLWK